jgi:mannose-6-phosphate isomerase
MLLNARLSDRTKEIIIMSDNANVEKSRFSQENLRAPSGFTMDIIKEGEGFKISRVEISPGNHFKFPDDLETSKRWVIVGGAGRVNLDQDNFVLHKGDALHIPAGVSHLITNPCWEKLVFLEIQWGIDSDGKI